MVLSVSKPFIGGDRLASSAAAAPVFFCVAFLLLHLVAYALLFRLPSVHAAVAALRAVASTIARVGPPITLAAFLVAGAEAFGPPEGLLVAALSSIPWNRASESPSGPAPDVNPAGSVPASLAFDENAWLAADFILVNPGHYAVGMKRLAPADLPFYRLVAKATDDQAERAMEWAWDMRKPVVGIDPALTRRVYAEGKIGEKLDGGLARDILSLHQPAAGIPSDKRIVAFHDLRSRRRRVGYLDKQSEAGFEFVDLLPVVADRGPATDPRAERREARYKVELISRTQVQPGTERLDPTDSELTVLSGRSSMSCGQAEQPVGHGLDFRFCHPGT